MYYPSSDGATNIRALLWRPDDLEEEGADTLCILQIMHGMGEHIERYRDFARFCTQNGIIVCGHDHVGHGKSVTSEGQWGHMPKNGKEVLVKDAHRLRELMQERYPSDVPSKAIPYVMFGHSMGSFVLRIYLAQYAEGVAAAIFSGTGQQPIMLSRGGSLLARFLGATKGSDYRSPLLHNLTVGAYADQLDSAETPLDWLSTDADVVADYIAAPDCGFMLDAAATIALTDLTATMVKRKTVAAIPTSLPLLFISGTEDPVGEMGKGVKRAVNLFRKTGHKNVKLFLCKGMRHEVLNERNKERVYDAILGWLKEKV